MWSQRMRAGRSGAWKTREPATMVSAPAAWRRGTVWSRMPPSAARMVRLEAAVHTAKNHRGVPVSTTAVTCSTGAGAKVWEDELRAVATVLATNGASFCAVGCNDGTVYTYTPAGRRVRPPSACFRICTLK